MYVYGLIVPLVFKLGVKNKGFTVKTRETERKYKLLPSFWYQSQRLTPNSFRERCDERSELVSSVWPVPDCLHIVTFPVPALFDPKQTQSPILHRTVLESYWELYAETGTKMTAATCTFVLFPLFLQQNRCFYAKFENPWNNETINVHLQLGWISFHIENATKMMKIPNMDINPQFHIFVSLQRRTVLNIKSVSPITKKSLPRGSNAL